MDAPDADPEITPAEFNNYQRMFQTFDADSSGTMDIDELSQVMGYVGNVIEKDELRRLVKEMDPDGDGDLTFEQFLTLMVRHKETNKYKVDSMPSDTSSHLFQALRGKKGRFQPDAPWRWAWESVLTLGTLYYVLVIFMLDCVLVKAFAIQGDPGSMTEQSIICNSTELSGSMPEHLMLGMERPSVYTILEVLWTMIFFTDILFNLNTSYVEGMKLVDDKKRIWRHYLTTHFTLDVASAIPMDLICFAMSQNIAGLVFYHLRLLRFVKTQFLFRRSNCSLITTRYARFHFAIVPIIKGSFNTICALHLMVVIRVALVWQDHECKLVPIITAKDYITSLYYVLYTLTGVGYGDIPVRHDFEKVYACFLFILGALLQGLIVGGVSQMLQESDLASGRRTQMQRTLAVLQYFEIPEGLQQEILGFQYHVMEHNFTAAYASVLEGLPNTMQDQLNLYVRIKFISTVPMFQSAHKECKVALAHELRSVVVSPEEFIICVGEEAHDMFFLIHGFADVIARGGKWLTTLQKGAFFGEAALLHPNTKRNATIKALSFCNLYKLGRESFRAILDRFPKFREAIHEEARSRAQTDGRSAVFEKRKSDVGRLIQLDAMGLDEVRRPEEATGTLVVVVHGASDLSSGDYGGSNDPYVQFVVGSEEFRTTVKETTLDPVWEEQFKVKVKLLPAWNHRLPAGTLQAVETIQFKAYDKDQFGRPDSLGEARVDLSSLPYGTAVAKSLALIGDGRLRVTLEAVDFGIPLSITVQPTSIDGGTATVRDVVPSLVPSPEPGPMSLEALTELVTSGFDQMKALIAENAAANVVRPADSEVYGYGPFRCVQCGGVDHGWGHLGALPTHPPPLPPHALPNMVWQDRRQSESSQPWAERRPSAGKHRQSDASQYGPGVWAERARKQSSPQANMFPR